MQEGSIVQQLQLVGERERLKNTAAIKSLIRCTHFLLVILLLIPLSCGGEDLRLFIERVGKMLCTDPSLNLLKQ